MKKDIVSTVFTLLSGVNETLLERISEYTVDHIHHSGSDRITELEIRIAINEAIRFNIVRLMGSSNSYPNDVLPYVLDDSTRTEWETYIKKYVVPFFIKNWSKK